MNIDLHRKKLRLGLIYGIVAGLAFAIFTWGVDALLLAHANASNYWVKIIPGLIISTLAGGIIGWLTMLFHRHGYALLLWGLLAILYSWLAVWLPFTVSIRIISAINPYLAHWFNFSPILDFGQFRLVSIGVIGLVAIICGLLEINFVDQSSLSPYLSGSVISLLVCIILFGLAGSAIDHLINSNLREPIQVVNTLLQFAQDNFGKEVPKTIARQMHLSATKQLGELIQKPRQLTLIGFDENLGIVNILVDFAGIKAKCTTIFAQPTDCIILPANQ